MTDAGEGVPPPQPLGDKGQMKRATVRKPSSRRMHGAVVPTRDRSPAGAWLPEALSQGWGEAGARSASSVTRGVVRGLCELLDTGHTQHWLGSP